MRDITLGDLTMVDVARAVAHTAHAGQVDKVGAPYILHPERVANRLMQLGALEDEVSVAWLHDVVEDTSMTCTDLIMIGFPPRVVDAVAALTREPGETYPQFIERVKTNPLAVAVKISDIEDNLDESRLAKIDDEATVFRLRKKYTEALMLLREVPMTIGEPSRFS